MSSAGKELVFVLSLVAAGFFIKLYAEKSKVKATAELIDRKVAEKGLLN